MNSDQISPGTEQRITLLFSPADQIEVRTILLEECGTNIAGWKSAGLERLHFAVLKISKGDLARLKQAVNLAKEDFRDVLMAAGFADGEHKYIQWLPMKHE
jgi:hypothetical protein